MDFLLYLMYVLMCGAARRRPLSCLVTPLARSNGNSQ